MEEDINIVLKAYLKNEEVYEITSIKATHRAYKIATRDGEFALRQYNPYTIDEHLKAQFSVAKLLVQYGTKTPIPLCAFGGKSFIEKDGFYWALFLWCSGRTGQESRIEDIYAVAEAAGKWIGSIKEAESNTALTEINGLAKQIRRRKEIAWIVPLDKVSQFSVDTDVFNLMSKIPKEKSGYHFKEVIDDVHSCVHKYNKMIEYLCIVDLPHYVTHGDLFPENLLIDDYEDIIIDLDCFSYEPQASDLARLVCRVGGSHKDELLKKILPIYQKTTELSIQEIEAIPLLMAGYHLYYALVHCMILLRNIEDQSTKRINRVKLEIAMFRSQMRKYE